MLQSREIAPDAVLSFSSRTKSAGWREQPRRCKPYAARLSSGKSPLIQTPPATSRRRRLPDCAIRQQKPQSPLRGGEGPVNAGKLPRSTRRQSPVAGTANHRMGASQARGSSIVVEGWAVLEVPSSSTALSRAACAVYFSLRCCMPCTSGGVPAWAATNQPGQSLLMHAHHCKVPSTLGAMPRAHSVMQLHWHAIGLQVIS